MQLTCMHRFCMHGALIDCAINCMFTALRSLDVQFNCNLHLLVHKHARLHAQRHTCLLQRCQRTHPHPLTITLTKRWCTPSGPTTGLPPHELNPGTETACAFTGVAGCKMNSARPTPVSTHAAAAAMRTMAAIAVLGIGQTSSATCGVTGSTA
jgi:hypothetical protein